MTAAILGIVGGIITIVAWFVTNRGKDWKQIERDKIDEAKNNEDAEIDKWANR